MKLSKAIEILADIANTSHYDLDPDDEAAIKLLIEAGKDVQKSRGTLRPGLYPLLPGEDPE